MVVYYVIQIGEHYYKHTDGVAISTEDEELAYAFTNLADAKQKAIEVEGAVRKEKSVTRNYKNCQSNMQRNIGNCQ